VKRRRRSRRVKVSADGAGLVSRAGVALLRELTEVSGLAEGWTGALLDTYKAFPTVHPPGRVLADLAVGNVNFTWIWIWPTFRDRRGVSPSAMITNS
jgi:hypothetical protein